MQVHLHLVVLDLVLQQVLLEAHLNNHNQRLEATCLVLPHHLVHRVNLHLVVLAPLFLDHQLPHSLVRLVPQVLECQAPQVLVQHLLKLLVIQVLALVCPVLLRLGLGQHSVQQALLPSEMLLHLVLEPIQPLLLQPLLLLGLLLPRHLAWQVRHLWALRVPRLLILGPLLPLVNLPLLLGAPPLGLHHLPLELRVLLVSFETVGL